MIQYKAGGQIKPIKFFQQTCVGMSLINTIIKSEFLELLFNSVDISAHF